MIVICCHACSAVPHHLDVPPCDRVCAAVPRARGRTSTRTYSTVRRDTSVRACKAPGDTDSKTARPRTGELAASFVLRSEYYKTLDCSWFPIKININQLQKEIECERSIDSQAFISCIYDSLKSRFKSQVEQKSINQFLFTPGVLVPVVL